MDPALLAIIFFGLVIWAFVRAGRKPRERTGQGSASARPLSPREEQEERIAIHRMVEEAWDTLTSTDFDETKAQLSNVGPQHVDTVAEIVGPTFEVYWRTTHAFDRLRSMPGYTGGMIVIERHPWMKQPLVGIPTEAGRVIIDSTAEPEWLDWVRADGWDIIYDNTVGTDGAIGVHFRRKEFSRRTQCDSKKSWREWWFES